MICFTTLEVDLPDLVKKLNLASLEMNGEFPEVMTHDSESEW